MKLLLWVRLPTILLLLIFAGYSEKAVAKDYFDGAVLKQQYVHFCVRNVRALKKMLLINHTKFEGRIASAGLSKALNCDLANDETFQDLMNDDLNDRDNVYIEKYGEDRYLEELKLSLSELSKKYKINELVQKAEGGLIAEDELLLLIAYQKFKSKIESIIVVVAGELK